MIVSANPTTGESLKSFAPHSHAQIEAALEAAAEAQRAWALRPISDRVGLLTAVAKVLRARKAEYARLITQEMGKPIAEAEAEVEKCAWGCEFYAENAGRFLADEPVASGATESFVAFQPLGVVLAVMPWNYPFWQLFRFVAPALAAGNGAILKHASNVPQCALAIEDALAEAGCPAGLFRALLVGPDAVGSLIADDRIAAVTLTGSTGAGSSVAAQAGSHLKKVVLELGGSDPFLVLADADIALAASTAVRARFLNVGQSCISAKRFIVEEAVADEFVDRLCAGVEQLRVGDPLDRQTTIGPMALGRLRDELHEQVERSLGAGAELRTGGHTLDGPGFFYAPTVLDRVTPSMTAFVEETFGPVAAVIRAADADEAIALANASEFGLGASVWSRDTRRASQVARRIEAGLVFVNGMVASDPRLPFGGVKKSGYGRELGVYGIREFTNIKTIWIGPPR